MKQLPAGVEEAFKRALSSFCSYIIPKHNIMSLMKECITCKETKELTEFSKNKNRKDGLQYRCKSCNKEYNKQHYLTNPDYRKQNYLDNIESYKQYNKQYRLSKNDGFYSVYLIPSDNYVGVTESLYKRMAQHKSIGRDITDYRILAQFNNREEALEVEELIHDLGYNGRHAKNRYV